MTVVRGASHWGPRVGWTLLALALIAFVWGMQRRARLEVAEESIIRLLFVPSIEQGTLVQRSDDLARFLQKDAGLSLRTEVPTSYAAVIQALGSGQADIAWMPAFAYLIANGRYGAQAKLQVVRSADRFAVVVTRSDEGEPEDLAALAGKAVAFPLSLPERLGDEVRAQLDAAAPGWTPVEAESDKDSVQRLLDDRFEIAAAVSSFVPSGPFDLVGDGRKELEYDRPGTIQSTRIIYTTEEPVEEHKTAYHGCIYSRVDSGIRRLEEFSGKRFAFSDETSTSGHIFPRMLLERAGVSLGRIYFAGSHPNVVQAVWDGKADGGSAFYSPPSAQQIRDGLLVGDARYILLKRMPDLESRQAFLEEVRVLALTDPIPNDLCAVRQGFSAELWRRFEASLQRFLTTEEGQAAYSDLLAGVAASPADDSTFDGFRSALRTAGVSAEGLLEAAEERLEAQKEASGGGP